MDAVELAAGLRAARNALLGGDDDDDGPNTNGPGMASCHSGPRSAAPAGPSSRSKELLARLLAPVAAAAAPSAGLAVPTLRALCLGLLGSHVEHLAGTEDMGPHLALLPPDVKACMLCVARRRGVLSNRILLGLVDPGWAVLDLAGAAALSERAVLPDILPHVVLRRHSQDGGGGGDQPPQPPQLPPHLDDCLAALVAPSAWAGGGCGGPGRGGAREAEWERLHIAEKFRLAYVQQDERLRAKARREAALAERQELRASGRRLTPADYIVTKTQRSLASFLH
eukprot:XP_001690274.1 predicted protein [Chlamydomonas reinhardtii]